MSKRKKVYLDCPENTSEEEALLLSKGAPQISKGKEELDDLAGYEPLELVPSKPLIDTWTRCIVADDGFLCFVQRAVAHCVFDNITTMGPPNLLIDGDDLYAGKKVFHAAITGSDKWITETLNPLKEAAKDMILRSITDPKFAASLCDDPCMTCSEDNTTISFPSTFDEFDAETQERQEAIRTLHCVQHLLEYVVAVVNESIVDCDSKDFIAVWERLLASGELGKSVAQWSFFSESKFVKLIAELYQCTRVVSDRIKK